MATWRHPDEGFPDWRQQLEPLRRLLGRFGRGRVAWLTLGVVLLLWLASGVYSVLPAERAVVLLFGRVVAETEPGLRYRLPWPIQSHSQVDVAQVRRAEVGFRTRAAATQPIPAEGLMLTGDENIVDVHLFIQYLVQDPVKFLFRARDPERALHASAEVALRAAVGQNTIDYTMTEGRVQAQNQVKTRLQELLDQYRTGLLVTEARLLAVDPPSDVRDAFHDVVRAFEDRERLVKKSEGYAEEVVPAARGQAAQVVLEAEAYREQRLLRANGDAARFLALLAEYLKAPDVMRERLYLESIERILSGADIFVLDTGSGGILPFLPLTALAPPAVPVITPTKPAPAK